MIYIWLVVIVLAVIIEAATPQLLSVWFAVGGLAGLIVTVLGGEIWLQVIVGTLVTIAALLLTRPLARKMMEFRKEDTNAGRYIGQEGMVTETIDNLNAAGQVHVLGSVWSARSKNGSVIEKGTLVVVEAIEGVKLIVSPK